MISYLELMDRASKGEKVSEREYEMRLFNKTSELVKEIGLKFDSEVVVPSDNTLADEVFEASLKLAIELGAYCLDNKRLLKFTESEFKERLLEIPNEITVGEGKEAAKIFCRKPDDNLLPFKMCAIACPYTEDLQPIISQKIAELPMISGVFTGNILNYRGIVLTPSLAVWTARRVVEWTREGFRNAGRPGMHFMAYPLAVRSDLFLGLLDQDHVRPTDIISAPCLPEGYKLSLDMLTLSQLAREYGTNVFEECPGWIGGWAGGPEGAVLESTAVILLGQLITKFDYGFGNIIPIIDANLDNLPEATWGESVIHQAISRNTNIKVVGMGAPAADPGTRQAYIERTIYDLALFQNGEAIWSANISPIKRRRENMGLPIDAMFELELIHGAAGMKREEINKILQRLYPLQPKEILQNPDYNGPHLDQVYDLKTMQPKKESVDLFKKMKKEMEGYGVPFKDLFF